VAIALNYAARSDVGLGRSSNQDSGYAGPHLLVVADGMGGHAGGDVASSLAVGELSVLDGESHGSDDAAQHLHDALDAANAQLRRRVGDEPDLAGMGTTVTAILRAGSRLVLAHIGDSRGYLLREGQLTQLTKDHSYVQSLIDEGRISPEEAERHPQRSVIMRVLTGRDDDEADVSVREAKPGDRYLLCSDGLSGVVSHETLAETLAAGMDPDATCQRLVELALRGGGPDNISCVVADVVELGGGPPPSTTPQVVGAAAFHRPRRSSAAGTPAARAAALRAAQREDSGDDSEDDDAPPGLSERERRRRRRRWIAGPVLLVLLLLAGGFAGWRWSQQQYFVGADGSSVAVYRGLTQDIGPLSTSHVVETSGISLADLPTTWADKVEARISSRDLAGARRTVSDLEDIAAACRAATTPAEPAPAAATSAPALPGTTPSSPASTTPSTPASSPASTPASTPTSSPTRSLTVEDCGGVG
jgi:PPM family protein phosphatase